MPMSAIRHATELQQAYNVVASHHMDSLFPDKPTGKQLAERQRVYEMAVRQLQGEQKQRPYLLVDPTDPSPIVLHEAPKR